MISSRRRQRTRHLLAIALILSVLIHILGGALWGSLNRILARLVPHSVLLASRQEPPEPRADVIRLERRAPAVARPAHDNRPLPFAPRPRAVVTPAPPLPHARHEIAHQSLHAPAQPPAAPAAAHVAIVPRRVRPISVAPPQHARPAYSDHQLAQLGQEFSKTIADSRETLGAVQAESERATVTTIKHYNLHFSGIHDGMNPGDGEIYPISHQRIGNTIWYYTRYTYMHGDGTYEADAIPWPFHYPIGDDPFARRDHERIPLQPPPEGYKPDRPLKPLLAQFFGGPAVND